MRQYKCHYSSKCKNQSNYQNTLTSSRSRKNQSNYQCNHQSNRTSKTSYRTRNNEARIGLVHAVLRRCWCSGPPGVPVLQPRYAGLLIRR